MWNGEPLTTYCTPPKKNLASMHIPSKHIVFIFFKSCLSCAFNNFHWLPSRICLWRPVYHLGISVSDHKNITKTWTCSEAPAKKSIFIPFSLRDTEKATCLTVNPGKESSGDGFEGLPTAMLATGSRHT